MVNLLFFILSFLKLPFCLRPVIDWQLCECLWTLISHSIKTTEGWLSGLMALTKAQHAVNSLHTAKRGSSLALCLQTLLILRVKQNPEQSSPDTDRLESGEMCKNLLPAGFHQRLHSRHTLRVLRMCYTVQSSRSAPQGWWNLIQL